MNFGLDEQGSGDVQPETPPSEEESVMENQEQEPSESEDSKEEEVNEEKPTEQQPVSETESPVVIKETKKETEIVKKTTEDIKPKTPVVTDTKKDEKKEVKVTTNKEANPTTPSNQGDKTKTVGDQGNPEGKVDAKALYGKPGGGAGGVGLDLAGWDWDEIPHPNIPNNESDGRIVVEIKVNSDGEVVGFQIKERGLSIAAEKACREAIEKLTFTKKAGATVPDITVGTITFVVKTR